MLIRNVLVAFLFVPCMLLGQNVVNGGFELPEDPIFPNDLSQLDRADGWEEALSNTTGPHTADWLSTCNSNHFNILEEDPLNPGTYVDIPANTGCRYGGMLPAELFQQDIGDYIDSDHLAVKMELNIRLPRQWHSSNSPNIIRDPQFTEGMTLDFYMSKEKITYVNEDAGCDAADDAGYEKNGDALVKVKSFPLSIIKYPQGEWHLIEVNFVAPSSNHQWIAFEFRIPSVADVACNVDYILVDDVSVEVTDCSNCSNCIAYDGCINYYELNNPAGTDSPFTIGGLFNVDYCKLEIFAEGGQLIRTIEVGNSPALISWDGKNDAGSEMPAGNYFYDIELINTCKRTKDWWDYPSTQKIVKATTEPTNNIPETMSYSPVLTLDLTDPCCHDCIEISSNTIDFIYPPSNISEIGGPAVITGDLELIAISKIIVDENVFFMSGSNVLLQAGEEIIFDCDSGNLNIFAGAEVVCRIDDCIPGFNAPPPQSIVLGGENISQSKDSSLDTLLTEKSVEQRSEFEKMNSDQIKITIYPNPSKTGMYAIDFNYAIDKEVFIEVADVLGNEVMSTKLQGNQRNMIIDISNKPNGVYYISVNYSGKSLVQKMVKGG